MSRIATKPEPGTAVALPMTGPQAVVPVRRPRFWSSAAATERQWLRDGFAPAEQDLEEFLAEAPPMLLCNIHRLVALLLVAMIGLATVLKVDIIVAAGGRLAVDSPTIVLQPMQLSVIRELHVKPGDVVRKGQILAALDATFTQADRAVLLAQRRALAAQLARLQAELDGTPLALGEVTHEAALEGQLYRQRRAEYAARLADFSQKVEGGDGELAAAAANQESLTQQLVVAREVETMRRALFRSEIGSRLSYLESQAARMRSERELQSATANLDALEHAMQSLKADRQQFVDTWRRELLEGLVKARAEDLAVGESLAKANRLNDLVVLRAPEDGLVLEVAKRSVGSVLQGAEPLITMISSDAALIAEVSIGSADVGYTKPGDEVAVKVDAFPFQRHGLLSGRLRSIGADSYPASGGNAAGGLYHRGQVELGRTELRVMPEGTRLIPGMTVTAEIKVGQRSVISYILYPIARGLEESLREP